MSGNRFAARHPVSVAVTGSPGYGAIPGVRGGTVPFNCVGLVPGVDPRSGAIPAPDVVSVQPRILRDGVTLFPWQQRGLRWLLGTLGGRQRTGGYLVWATATGKTITALSYWSLLADTIIGPPADGACGAVSADFPLIYVTLGALRYNVRSEVRNRTVIDVGGGAGMLTGGAVAVINSNRNPKAEPTVHAAAIVILSYANVTEWRDLLAEKMRAAAGAVIVFDEAHCLTDPKRRESYVDDAGLPAYRPRNNANYACEVLSRAATYRIGMSATPAPGYRIDCWNGLDWVDPDGWGSYGAFATRYCGARPGEHGGLDMKGKTNSAEFQARISVIVNRVSKAEVSALLPPFTADRILLTGAQLCRPPTGTAEWVKARTKAGHGYEAQVMAAAARKRRWVVDYVTTRLVNGGDAPKITLITGRRADVDALVAALLESVPTTTEIMWTDGRHEAAMRQEIVERYMARDTAKAGPVILVGTDDCLGTGTNLQDTDLAIEVMLPITPARAVQRRGRFARPGQTRPCLYLSVIAEGTIDERVLELILNKINSVADNFADPEEIRRIEADIQGNVDEDDAILAEMLAAMRGGPG